MTTALERLRGLRNQANQAERKSAFRAAMNRINDRWGDLTYDTLKTKFPELYKTTEETEDALNQAWNDCRPGKATQPDFDKALSDWEAAHIQAIQGMGETRESRRSHGSSSKMHELPNFDMSSTETL